MIAALLLIVVSVSVFAIAVFRLDDDLSRDLDEWEFNNENKRSR